MAFDIQRYLNIRSAHSGAVSHDGEDIAFLMDTTGVPQVWTVSEPQSWPTQRTFYDERITFIDWSPQRKELAFGMDEGGNERQQLFVLDPTTGQIRSLTDRPEAKHRWGGWSHDGDQFAFASNRRNQAVFDIYVQDRDSDEPVCLHEGDGWLSVAGWSPDDQYVLVHEARSSFDHDLYVVDTESGDIEQLTDHEEDIRYTSPQWGPNGDRIYLATDEDADTLYLGAIDLDSREIDQLVEGGDWNINGVAVDEDTGRIVYSRNVDGYTELTAGNIADPTTVDVVSTPDLPNGVAGGIDFFPDGNRYTVTVTARQMNSNVYIADFETGELSRVTDAPTAGIPRETFQTPELIHYETFDDREIPAFFSLPEEHEQDNTPVIVDIHGGPESQRRPSFSALRQYFLTRGYAVFEPNVRGSTGYGRHYTHLDDVRNRMDSVADIKAGVEWLHDHPAVDPDRIAVMGGSYGGFMVLASLTEYPELWAAGVDIVGIANFVTFLENTGDWRRELREAEYGSLTDDREFLEEVSPINNIDALDSPLFVLHGENDPRVPVGEAEQIVEQARQQGVPVRKLIFEDEGHGISKLDNKIEGYSAIASFLDEHV